MDHVKEPELHLCVSTILGDPMAATADEIVEGVGVAAAAGFDGVSLWTLHHLVAAGSGVDLAALTAELGLAVPVVEALAGWANAADEAAVRADAEFALGVAAAVGATHAVAVCLEPELEDRDRTVQNLGLAAALAADAGVTIAIEFLPWTGIPTIASCAQLIEDADADNVGILVDMWHWQRQPGGPDLHTLRSLDGSLVPLVQVCDTGPAAADLYDEAMTARVLPGEGDTDGDALAAALAEIGATPLISPEIFNTSRLADRGALAWAQDIEASCRRLPFADA